MRHRTVWITLLALAALLLTSQPATAGGWVTVELNQPLADLHAGEAVTVGFLVQQHGDKPINLEPPPVLVATHATAGERVEFVSQQRGQQGHYTVQVELPSAGTWQWRVDPAPFPAVELEPVEVGAATAASASSILLQKWTANSVELHAVDPATGQATPGREPLQFERLDARAFAPARDTLALVESAGYWDTLHLLNLDTWELVTSELSTHQARAVLAWRADGAQLAAAMREGQSTLVAEPFYRLALVDAADGSVLNEIGLDFAPHAMRYTADGSALAVYGTPVDAYALDEETPPAAPTVALFDAQTLARQWSAPLDGVLHGAWCEARCDNLHDISSPEDAPRGLYWTPAVVFAPDASALHVAHADAGKLTTVDLVNRRVQTLDIRPPQTWLERWIERVLSLFAQSAQAKVPFAGANRQALPSPDGSRLYLSGTRYVIGEADGQVRVQAEPLGVQLVDAATGHLLAQTEQPISVLALAQDGRRLLAPIRQEDEESKTVVLDAQSLESVEELDGAVRVAQRLNGEPVLLRIARPKFESTISVLDGETFAPLHEWSMNGHVGVVDVH